jgi:hypothetical protein
MPVIPINYCHFIVLHINVSLSLPSNKKKGFLRLYLSNLKLFMDLIKKYPMCHPKTCADRFVLLAIPSLDYLQPSTTPEKEMRSCFCT